MTSYLDSHNKPEILSADQTRNGIQHNEYNIHGIAHVHVHECRKDDIVMQRGLFQNFTYIYDMGE